MFVVIGSDGEQKKSQQKMAHGEDNTNDAKRPWELGRLENTESEGANA